MKSMFLTSLICATLAFGAGAFAHEGHKSKKAPAAGPVNKKCPVQGGDVDPAVTATHAGKTIGFCCEGCVKPFAKDPEKFMKVLAANGDDSTIKKNDAAKKADDAKKGAGAAKAKMNKMCPVHPDNPVDATVTTEHNGKPVGFCCEDCLKSFNADPDRYVKAEKKK